MRHSPLLVAAFLLSFSVGPAGAMKKSDSTNLVSREGRTCQAKKVSERASVKSDAVVAWERLVAKKLGPQWAHWSDAHDQHLDCYPSHSVSNHSGTTYYSAFCHISAKPCLLGR